MEKGKIISSTVNCITSMLIDTDSSDSDDEFIIEVSTKNNSFSTRTKITNYFSKTVCNYTDADFKSHFRITRNTFSFLKELLSPHLERKSARFGRHTLCPEMQLLFSLWFLSTPNSFRCVSDRFGIGKSTAWRSVQRVTTALYSYLHTFIKWPSTEEAKITMARIKQQYGFPKVVGAIDGTHISIAAPKENPEAYVNRKGYHFLQLQAVCDETLKFIHVYCGEVGSVHDMRIFRLSNIIDMCSEENFPDNSHLIGDAAYEVQKYIMVPYRNNGHLSEQKVKFNTVLSSSRMIIERSFGLLKGRFRSILDKLPMIRTDLIPRYIIACCILHNICILKDDLIDIPILVHELRRVNNLNDSMRNANILKTEGIEKRNAITYLLSNEL
ncbi:putative nuclease HARBI1 [Prorops nasuta]|uniref:putative nuclease HARBI1 n=1 Tax=Prorops nasuta TaxID=863751 RepID=UPI0034D00EE0